jgi:hypothetical protein
MSSLRQAAKLALEALERADKISGYPNSRATVKALRQALQQQSVEAEQQAEKHQRGCTMDLPFDETPDECVIDTGDIGSCIYAIRYGEHGRHHCGAWKPIYIQKHRIDQQPAQQPLTDEQIDALAIDGDGLPNSHLEFARAIERSHGIGETK